MRQNIAALSLKRFEMKFNELPHVIILCEIISRQPRSFSRFWEDNRTNASTRVRRPLSTLDFLSQKMETQVCLFLHVSPTSNKTHNNLHRKLRGQLNWPCQTLFKKSSESDQRFPRLHFPKVGFYTKKKQLKARIKS